MSREEMMQFAILQASLLADEEGAGIPPSDRRAIRLVVDELVRLREEAPTTPAPPSDDLLAALRVPLAPKVPADMTATVPPTRRSGRV